MQKVDKAHSACSVTGGRQRFKVQTNCLKPPAQAPEPSPTSSTHQNPLVLTSLAASVAHLRMMPPCWFVRDAWAATTCGV